MIWLLSLTASSLHPVLYSGATVLSLYLSMSTSLPLHLGESSGRHRVPFLISFKELPSFCLRCLPQLTPPKQQLPFFLLFSHGALVTRLSLCLFVFPSEIQAVQGQTSLFGPHPSVSLELILKGPGIDLTCKCLHGNKVGAVGPNDRSSSSNVLSLYVREVQLGKKMTVCIINMFIT